MSDFYLVDEREAELVAGLIAQFDPQIDSDRLAVDKILCELIDMGLCDAFAGPACYEAWLKMDPMDSGMRERLEAVYADHDEEEI